MHISNHVNNTNDVIWNCTCDTFRVLMCTVQGTYGKSSWEEVQCLRYIEEELVKMKCGNKTEGNDEICPLTKCSVLKRIYPLKNEQKMLHSPVEFENDLITGF